MSRRFNASELSQMYQKLGPRETCRRITEWLDLNTQGKSGGVAPSDFSIRDLAEAVVPNGREWVRNMDPRYASSVLESGGPVDSTAFSNIAGQLLINQLMRSYQSEEFIFSQLVPNVSTRLSGEKIPGITGIGDKAQEIKEGMPYPHAGVGEDYIETPATAKDGIILALTKEAIFFDRTGLLLQQASQVGEALGIKKEKSIIDVVIGYVNNHKWKGTSYNTYQTSTPWINKLTGATKALVDWSSVELAEALFDEMVDPNTGEPVIISAMQLIGTPSKRHTINRILNATEVRYTGSGSATETIAANPMRGAGYRGITSRLLYSRLKAEGATADQAKATWFLGDIAKAFAYMENWPITVTQAPNNSEAEFTNDIVARFKASERGAPASMNPRFMVRVNGHD